MLFESCAIFVDSFHCLSHYAVHVFHPPSCIFPALLCACRYTCTIGGGGDCVAILGPGMALVLVVVLLKRGEREESTAW